LRSC